LIDFGAGFVGVVEVDVLAGSGSIERGRWAKTPVRKTPSRSRVKMVLMKVSL